jgi:hypothetical protein
VGRRLSDRHHPVVSDADEKDYTIGMNIILTAVDDPDVAFYENYVCGSQRN